MWLSLKLVSGLTWRLRFDAVESYERSQENSDQVLIRTTSGAERTVQHTMDEMDTVLRDSRLAFRRMLHSDGQAVTKMNDDDNTSTE